MRSNSTYFAALAAHLQHHADGELLAAHMPAIRLCAERLIQLRVQEHVGGDGWLPDKHAAACADALHTAVLLAQAAGSNVDATLESEAAYLAQQVEAGANQDDGPRQRNSQRQGAKQLVGRRADGRCSRLGRLRRLLSRMASCGWIRPGPAATPGGHCSACLGQRQTP